MYSYLNRHYELYWIETDDGEGFRPIGDVAFGEDDMPIVIGDPAFANTKRLKLARAIGSGLERKKTPCRPQS